MFTVHVIVCVRLSEAEVALTGNIFQRLRSSPDDLVNDFGEVAPFTFHLLAKIYRYVNRLCFDGLVLHKIYENFQNLAWCNEKSMV